MKTKKKIVTLVILALMAFAVTGCSAIQGMFSRTTENLTGKAFTLTEYDHLETKPCDCQEKASPSAFWKTTPTGTKKVPGINLMYWKSPWMAAKCSKWAIHA